MKTSKKALIVLDEGDQAEVSCGDITVHFEHGYQEGRGVVIRIQRPPTDGRFLGLQWSELHEGNPVCRDAKANGWLQVEPQQD